LTPNLSLSDIIWMVTKMASLLNKPISIRSWSQKSQSGVLIDLSGYSRRIMTLAIGTKTVITLFRSGRETMESHRVIRVHTDATSTALDHQI